MTVEDRATIKAVILPADKTMPLSRTGQLLSDYGHEVASAHSAEEAGQLLRQDVTDLLVVDVTNSAENRAFVTGLADLSPDYLPRQLAIFSDCADETLRGLRKRISPCKVHIFLKPLHMHGLLGLLRQLECPV
jgi:CheY-like chemotaxis protein